MCTLCRVVLEGGDTQECVHYAELYLKKMICKNVYIMQSCNRRGQYARMCILCRVVIEEGDMQECIH